MPIYEFKCKKCNHIMEEIVKNSKKFKTQTIVCKKCYSIALRIPSLTSFRLKDTGVGWAKDNYARKKSVLDNPPK